MKTSLWIVVILLGSLVLSAKDPRTDKALDDRLYDTFRRTYLGSSSSVGYYESDGRQLKIKERWRDSLDLPLPETILMSELRGPTSDGELIAAPHLVVVFRVRSIDLRTKFVGLGDVDGGLTFLQVPRRSDLVLRIRTAVLRERVSRPVK